MIEIGVNFTPPPFIWNFQKNWAKDMTGWAKSIWIPLFNLTIPIFYFIDYFFCTPLCKIKLFFGTNFVLSSLHTPVHCPSYHVLSSVFLKISSDRWGCEIISDFNEILTDCYFYWTLPLTRRRVKLEQKRGYSLTL